jgi:hypothetical protein
MTEFPVCSSRASDQPAAAALPASGVFFRGARCSLEWRSQSRAMPSSGTPLRVYSMKRVLNILQDSRSLSLMPSINLHCFFHGNIALFLS